MTAAPRARPGLKEYLALPLLLVGGLVVPAIGWIAGVLLLWLSHVWTVRQKLVGTLLVPGGLVGAFFLFFVGGYTETCIGVGEAGSPATLECSGAPSSGAQALWLALLVLLVAIPILTTVYLGRAVYRADAPAAEAPAEA